jgi:hypothetical protein
MSYQKKYLKYKNKYLTLKNQLGSGGLDTISDINEDIFKKYPSVVSQPENINKDNFGICFEDKSLNLSSINTSSNKFDCLIHSFLDCTCPNFRKLTQSQKDSYANWFRREYFYSLFEKSPTNKIYKFLGKDDGLFNELLGDLKPVIYLQGYHALLLAELYKINIIVITKVSGQFKQAKLDSGSDKTIIIYNPGDGHFRGVRKNSDTFMFTKDDNAFIESVLNKYK